MGERLRGALARYIYWPRRGGLFMPCPSNRGTDQPARPRSLIGAFVVRCLDSIIPILPISKVSGLNLVSEAEQAGWRLA